MEDAIAKLSERERKALAPFLEYLKGLPESRLAVLAATDGETGETRGMELRQEGGETVDVRGFRERQP